MQLCKTRNEETKKPVKASGTSAFVEKRKRGHPREKDPKATTEARKWKRAEDGL